MEGETLTGDTTGAGDRNPYTGCAGWFIGNPDLTYAFVAESAGCYRFTAGDPESEEDPIAAWNTSIAIADSCEVDSFYDCDDASSGWWGYIDASLDSYLSAGEEVYVLVNGNVPDGTLTAEGPGEFEISITQLGTGMCSDEEF